MEKAPISISAQPLVLSAASLATDAAGRASGRTLSWKPLAQSIRSRGKFNQFNLDFVLEKYGWVCDFRY